MLILLMINSNNSARFLASAQIEAGYPRRKQERAVPSPIANHMIRSILGISETIIDADLAEKGDVSTSNGHFALGTFRSIVICGQSQASLLQEYRY